MAPNRVAKGAGRLVYRYRWGIVVGLLMALAATIVILAVVYSDARAVSTRQETQIKLARVEIEGQASIREATAIALWDRYDNDIFACRRGNTVRAHIRGNDSAIKSLAEILAPYLTTSAALRKAAAGGDRVAAQALFAAESIAAVAKGIQPIPPVKCDKTIVKPGVPRPLPKKKAKPQKEVNPS